MSNITLTEREIKLLLIATLKNSGIEIDDIVFKQKIQLFGKGRGIEITAELVKKEEENDINSLLNKITYQTTNKFVPVETQQSQFQQQLTPSNIQTVPVQTQFTVSNQIINPIEEQQPIECFNFPSETRY